MYKKFKDCFLGDYLYCLNDNKITKYEINTIELKACNRYSSCTLTGHNEDDPTRPKNIHFSAHPDASWSSLNVSESKVFTTLEQANNFIKEVEAKDDKVKRELTNALKNAVESKVKFTRDELLSMVIDMYKLTFNSNALSDVEKNLVKSLTSYFK